MEYRKFGELGFHASVLGFGCLRLPTLTDNSDIDQPEAIRMIRHAVDCGVNYIDTAYTYHGGNSERAVGKALLDGYRQRVKIATKIPAWKVQGPSDFDRYLDDQLDRLQTDHVDFYLLHALQKPRWEFVRDMGYLRWAEKAMADGRIGHLGFSIHDGYDALKSIIDDYDGWSLCQVQYNYLDVTSQAGTKGVRYAASRGLAVVVMEPLLGGKLANPPDRIQAVWDRAERRRTPADWALQWLWNQPEITVVLSGMTTMEQVVENVASADGSKVHSLTRDELSLFVEARELYNALYPIPCTQCSYCMPCPNGVAIPYNMMNFNRAVAMNALRSSRSAYYFLSPGMRASECVQCRLCESKCPQKIPISDWMSYIHDVLGADGDLDLSRAPGRS